MRKVTVNLGDLFVKTGQPPSRWVVEKLIRRADMPDHVRLRKKDQETKTITVALSVLTDTKHFRLLERAAAA